MEQATLALQGGSSRRPGAARGRGPALQGLKTGLLPCLCRGCLGLTGGGALPLQGCCLTFAGGALPLQSVARCCGCLTGLCCRSPSTRRPTACTHTASRPTSPTRYTQNLNQPNPNPTRRGSQPAHAQLMLLTPPTGWGTEADGQAACRAGRTGHRTGHRAGEGRTGQGRGGHPRLGRWPS